MKDLSPDDHPREKLWQHGAAARRPEVALVVAQGGRNGCALMVAFLARGVRRLHGEPVHAG
jgi:hypothetical protein